MTDEPIEDNDVYHNRIEEEYWGEHTPLSQLNRKVRRRRGRKKSKMFTLKSIL